MNNGGDAAEQVVRLALEGFEAVSYTHLDVYKRQDNDEQIARPFPLRRSVRRLPRFGRRCSIEIEYVQPHHHRCS